MSSDPVSFRDCVEEYLVALRVERGLADNSIKAYRRDLNQYLQFLDGAEPDQGMVEEFLTTLGDRNLASSTLSRKIASLRGLHRFLASEGYRGTDPTTLLETPRQPPPFPKALLVEEAASIVEAPDLASPKGRRDSALLEFLYGTGARVSEAVGLDLGMLDLEDRIVIVTGKGSRQRLIPLGGHAVAALRRWFPDRLSLLKRTEPGDPVFLNLAGRRLSRQGAFDVVKANAARAGIDRDKV